MGLLAEGIAGELKSDAGIDAIVGEKIFIEYAYQDEDFPFMTFTINGNNHESHLAGGSGLTQAQFGIDCWARSAETAHNLFDLVRKLLDNRRHVTDFGGIVGLTVQFIRLTDDEADFETPGDSDEDMYHRYSGDFICWYQESLTPTA